MVRSAIALQCVHAECPVDGMLSHLLDFAADPRATSRWAPGVATDSSTGDHQRILDCLRRAQGVDFSRYKETTIGRRMERRMRRLGRTTTLATYADVVARDRDELDHLYADLLIGVTSFFRDPEAFAAVRQLFLEPLADAAEPGRELRFWVCGCSTGEEAYALAMLALETFAAKKKDLRLRVLATDVHQASLQTASKGF